MELIVSRFEKSNNDLATIGILSIDGVRECFTLEDKVREIDGQPVSAWKISEQTAIPSGRYKVTLAWSPRHACMVPLVNDVPGFSAIEIHWGNRDVDTAGCLLLGQTHVAGQDYIGGSVLAWNSFMPKVEKALGMKRAAIDGAGKPLHYERVGVAEEVWITYQNNFEVISPLVGAG